jgi:hypothetical protein
MEKKPARKTRDVNQLAKAILDAATGEQPTDTGKVKDLAAMARGRKGGLKGGKARAAKLTKKQLTENAQKAARSRWAKRHESESQ